MEKNFETLEEGAWYKRRDGKVVGPAKLRDDRNPDSLYCYEVGGWSYTESGQYQINRKSTWDLIEKVEAPLAEPVQTKTEMVPEAQPARNFEKLELGALYIRRDGMGVGPVEASPMRVFPYCIGSVNYNALGDVSDKDAPTHPHDLITKVEDFRSVKNTIEAHEAVGASVETEVILNRIPHNPEAAFEELEEGCYYRNRAGQIVGPAKACAPDENGIVLFGINQIGYQINGKYGFTEKPHPGDLLEKVSQEDAFRWIGFDHKIETDSMKDDIRFAEIVFKGYRGKLINASIEAADEALRAKKIHIQGYASPHEGYGVLMEEVAELFDEIRKKEKDRDLYAMRKEATQVAAVALRFIVELTEA